LFLLDFLIKTIVFPKKWYIFAIEFLKKYFCSKIKFKNHG
jgi:hypothetical protein